MTGGTNCSLGLASGGISLGHRLLTDNGQQTGCQPNAKRHAVLPENRSIPSFGSRSGAGLLEWSGIIAVSPATFQLINVPASQGD
jgi:hypothetical protein